MNTNDKYIKSKQLLKLAKEVTPLGAQTFSKSYRYFCEGNAPSFIDKGEGCYIYDIDNNEYIDFICALGAVIIGYNNKSINNKIIKQLSKGITFSQPSPISIDLAQKIVEVIPCAEMVRFVKNGSDATASAVRLARAYTKKDIVAVCGYHGMQDWYIASTENDSGIPKGIKEYIKKFKYNNIDSLKQIIEDNKNNVAAVIMEPIQGNGPDDNFLEEIRALTIENNIILVFDEVISGFRYALGGASELYNVIPDLASIGKGMANGMPISAVVGRKDILKLIETDNVFISTTFGGETLSMVSALETINILSNKEAFKKVWNLGTKMLDGIRELIKKYNLDCIITSYGLAPHCGVVFNDYKEFNALDFQSVFQQTMIERGILTLGINNINQAHTDKEINSYLEAFEEALISINKVLEDNTLDGILKAGKINPIFKRNKRKGD
jgi:glutamate-1-semialdehyde-2,1-aminomutase